MALEFDASPLGFDVDNAYFLGKACEAAYKKNHQELIALAVEQLGLEEDNINPFDTEDEDEDVPTFHGFVAKGDGFALLAFRGSETLDPWLAEDNMIQKPGFGGMVHKGFAEAFESVWDLVEPLVTDAVSDLEEDAGLWITGHGLGGALALLAGARLDDQRVNVRAIYNFGTPRVGNMDFFFNYPVCTYRIVNNHDIIPHVPAEKVFVGFNCYTYAHVGTFKFIDQHGWFGEGINNWDRQKELMQTRWEKMGQPPTSFFQDHHLDNYLEAIAKYSI